MTPPTLGFMPPGSEQIAYYARMRRLRHDVKPQEDWFRRWEPHETLVSPEHWYNSVSMPQPWGLVVIAEPWTAGEGLMPIERALVAFVELGGMGHMPRAAMRVGEPFLTKVAFLEKPPLPQVEIGDPIWDQHVTTFAFSADEARQAFPPRLRDLLRTRGFRGHLEIRPQGLVIHPEGLVPRGDHYDTAYQMAHDVAYVLRH